MRARIRGIYTTALTRAFLDEGHEVVQASAPIRDRFDADFAVTDHDVDVETTDDRQGVGVTGTPDDVETVRDILCEVGIDTLAWDAAAPRDAIFDGRVTETLSNGAIVDLDVAEGFLPYGNVEDRIETGDALRVQVCDTTAPWVDSLPVLDTTIRARGGLATLVYGKRGVSVDTYDDAAGRELAGMTDLLDVDRPDGWGLEWAHPATEAGLDALSTALHRAAERTAALESALSGPVEAPRRRAAPTATTWFWFGRETRFALDDRRREVTATMPGHHRIKAATAAASTAVDFAEGLGTDAEEFPFDVVTRTFGPAEGDTVSIGHGKPEGNLIVLGSGDVVDRDDDTITVRREMTPGGTYDALDVPRSAGDVAVTRFKEGRWWYPTVYRDDEGDRKGTYVNVCTPVEVFPDTVRYVDLHVDVVKYPDDTVERVDDDELDDAVEAGHVPESLAKRARKVAASIERAL
jgi:protein associated with RNAse G/E